MSFDALHKADPAASVFSPKAGPKLAARAADDRRRRIAGRAGCGTE